MSGDACSPRGSADPSGDEPVDFGFLRQQTFDDVELQRDVLRLFVTQAARIVSSLPTLQARAQADAAHLLKGSARGIGAWAIAGLAETYEADIAGRGRLHGDLAAEVARAAAAIRAHLADQLGGEPSAASIAPAR